MSKDAQHLKQTVIILVHLNIKLNLFSFIFYGLAFTFTLSTTAVDHLGL